MDEVNTVSARAQLENLTPIYIGFFDMDTRISSIILSIFDPPERCLFLSSTPELFVVYNFKNCRMCVLRGESPEEGCVGLLKATTVDTGR